MKVFLFVFFAVVLSFSSPEPTYSFSGQVITHQNTPLMMIRFNQRKVFYERQLYNAVSRAFDVKPNASFELVQYVPTGKNEDASKRAISKAQKNMNMIMRSLAEIGVPQNRVSVITESDRSAKFDEVHIYVR